METGHQNSSGLLLEANLSLPCPNPGDGWPGRCSAPSHWHISHLSTFLPVLSFRCHPRFGASWFLLPKAEMWGSPVVKEHSKVSRDVELTERRECIGKKTEQITFINNNLQYWESKLSLWQNWVHWVFSTTFEHLCNYYFFICRAFQWSLWSGKTQITFPANTFIIIQTSKAQIKYYVCIYFRFILQYL